MADANKRPGECGSGMHKPLLDPSPAQVHDSDSRAIATENGSGSSTIPLDSMTNSSCNGDLEMLEALDHPNVVKDVGERLPSLPSATEPRNRRPAPPPHEDRRHQQREHIDTEDGDQHVVLSSTLPTGSSIYSSPSSLSDPSSAPSLSPTRSDIDSSSTASSAATLAPASSNTLGQTSICNPFERGASNMNVFQQHSAVGQTFLVGHLDTIKNYPTNGTTPPSVFEHTSRSPLCHPPPGLTAQNGDFFVNRVVNSFNPRVWVMHNGWLPVS